MIEYSEDYFETETEKTLFRKLKEFRDSYDFVVGIMVELRHNEPGMTEMIEYLNAIDKTVVNGGDITEKAAIIAGNPLFYD